MVSTAHLEKLKVVSPKLQEIQVQEMDDDLFN